MCHSVKNGFCARQLLNLRALVTIHNLGRLLNLLQRACCKHQNASGANSLNIGLRFVFRSSHRSQVTNQLRAEIDLRSTEHACDMHISRLGEDAYIIRGDSNSLEVVDRLFRKT